MDFVLDVLNLIQYSAQLSILIVLMSFILQRF